MEDKDKLEALIEKYVKKGIPRKMAVIMARAKLKKENGGGSTDTPSGNKGGRFRRLKKKTN